jgi:hypothetical protein
MSKKTSRMHTAKRKEKEKSPRRTNQRVASEQWRRHLHSPLLQNTDRSTCMLHLNRCENILESSKSNHHDLCNNTLDIMTPKVPRVNPRWMRGNTIDDVGTTDHMSWHSQSRRWPTALCTRNMIQRLLIHERSTLSPVLNFRSSPPTMVPRRSVVNHLIRSNLALVMIPLSKATKNWERKN